ncbi:MAG: DUF2752 domain-containing protein [Bacteroidales bacterium]|nr:DUF2752 domain-containing protein [Bacteroidales bacterium]
MQQISEQPEHKTRLRDETYLLVNVFLAGIIFLIILYSGIFSPVKDNYPVVCIHEKITGEPCPSCGLSHSLSLILRGRFEEAYKWNQNGIAVFIFFVAQLFLRIFFSRYYINYPGTRQQLIVTDAIGSSVMFLLAFAPFITAIFKWL